MCLCRYSDAHETLSEAKLERIFIFCLTWSLGGLLSERDRAGFDAELRSIGANLPPKDDESDTVFEYLVDDATRWAAGLQSAPGLQPTNWLLGQKIECRCLLLGCEYLFLLLRCSACYTYKLIVCHWKNTIERG